MKHPCNNKRNSRGWGGEGERGWEGWRNCRPQTLIIWLFQRHIIGFLLFPGSRSVVSKNFLFKSIVREVMCFACCHIAYISPGSCKDCVKEPPPHHQPPPLHFTHSPSLCTILLHYELVVTDFPFFSNTLFDPNFTKRLWFFGGKC